MELQKRLDSQQSMLQCIIHTLTVSKLSHMESRSKKDSEHISGLKSEIRLLKTFIMESYNNLTELRRAEQSAEAESRFDSESRGPSHPVAPHPYGDGGNAIVIPVDGPNAYEPRITRSPSLRPSASNSDSENSGSDDGADDDDDGVNSTTSTNQSDNLAAGGTCTPNAEELLMEISHQPLTSAENDRSDSRAQRESNILLQIVPYRPRVADPIRSEGLIWSGQSSDSGRMSAKQEATNSVRLLLDKWTNSGSAPIANILDEEAAREKDEAADKRRILDSQYDGYRRPPSLGAQLDEDDFGTQRYTGYSAYPPRFQDDHAPPPPTGDYLQPPYGYPLYANYFPRHKDFWRPSLPFPQIPDGQLGVEILAALRSTRGGIQYTKSNKFKQVHYVDQHPIYTCALVPSHMVPSNEMELLNTELDIGLVRGEALDLLGYTYTETEAGKFVIQDDLELRDVEELVKLSYQALDRKSRQLSKAVIKKRGWAEAIDLMCRDMPSMYRYHHPPMTEHWNQSKSPYSAYPGHGLNTELENDFPIKTASSQASLGRPRYYERERPKRLSVSTPPEILRREQGASKPARPEVRFTLPRAQLVSSPVDTTNESHASEPNPNVPKSSEIDEDLPKLNKKLEELIRKRAESVRSGNHDVATDLTYYAIPDLEKRIKVLKEQRRGKQKKRSAPLTGNDEDRKFHHTEVETESEDNDDDGASKMMEVV